MIGDKNTSDHSIRISSPRPREKFAYKSEPASGKSRFPRLFRGMAKIIFRVSMVVLVNPHPGSVHDGDKHHPEEADQDGYRCSINQTIEAEQEAVYLE
ncbi:MAG: hypothetical protein WHT46_01915 [Candidatus Geothermincolales bacterium]